MNSTETKGTATSKASTVAQLLAAWERAEIVADEAHELAEWEQRLADDCEEYDGGYRSIVGGPPEDGSYEQAAWDATDAAFDAWRALDVARALSHRVPYSKP